MPDYRDAIKKVLEHEGGFVNHKADKGGPTNWGVTQAVYDKYIQEVTKNPSYKSTIAEIQNMPIGNALAIYKKNYWDVIQGDKITRYAIAAAIFDQAINRGPVAAVKQAQRLLGLTDDGKVGPTTLSYLNKVDEAKFLASYLAASKTAYQQIVANNPSQAVFLTGWLNRVDSLKNYVTSYIGTINGTTVGIGVGVIAMLGVGGFFLYKYMSSTSVAKATA